MRISYWSSDVCSSDLNPLWDGRFQNVQVTDTRPEAIEVRALMTARDASRTFDLRCDVREAMLAFVRREMPEAIVRHRTVIERRGDLPARDGTGASRSEEHTSELQSLMRISYAVFCLKKNR